MSGVIKLNGAALSYWAGGMFGDRVPANEGAASLAVLLLDDGSRVEFELPAGRVALATVLAVLASGIKIGRWQKINEVRDVLGVRPISSPNKVK